MVVLTRVLRIEMAQRNASCNPKHWQARFRYHVPSTTRTVATMSPAAMIANSRFVRLHLVGAATGDRILDVTRFFPPTSAATARGELISAWLEVSSGSKRHGALRRKDIDACHLAKADGL
jgi:hypothetical protein